MPADAARPLKTSRFFSSFTDATLGTWIVKPSWKSDSQATSASR